MRIYWVSRHRPLPSQIRELERLAGGQLEVVQDPNPFANAEEIKARFERNGCDDLVVVAPLSVFQRLVELGLRPLYAEMEKVPPEEAEVFAGGRGYRFRRFRRVRRLALEFEEHLELGKP